MSNLWILFVFMCLGCTSSSRSAGTNDTDLNEALQNKSSIVFENKTFTEEIDIIEAIFSSGFPKDMDHIPVHGALKFINCKFQGDFISSKQVEGVYKIIEYHQAIQFINCEFQGKVNFKGNVFRSKAYFYNCTFLEEAVFQNSIFMDHAAFNETTFQEDALFQDSRYYLHADFFNLQADKNLLFQGATFRDRCNFSNTTILKYCDFSRTKHYGISQFNYMLVKDRITFNNSVFYGDVQVLDSRFSNMENDGIHTFLKSKWKIMNE